MSTQQSTIEYIIDQLAGGEAVSSRKMFGEYALYCKGKVVALVCDDTLFVKITEEGREFIGDVYKEGAPYPGAKPWMMIDADKLEDHHWLRELIDITAEHAPLPKVKTKKKK